MDERTLKWLHDIKVAIDEIDSFFMGHEKRIEYYKTNIVVKRAIERELEIIGEATNRILIRTPDIQIDESKSIIGLRNFIIHSYDNITDETIWAIIINHLPRLKVNIESLLENG
ncbi:MAG: hypothetical protein FD181_3193 [Prolixibacteraceae bacterium]|nr:MAG: hypothetical protein FD181_3193 [Prolixibacteraceae bacterium]